VSTTQQGFDGEIWGFRDHLEGLGVDGKPVLKWMFEKLDGIMDWIDLGQDRDKRRALVNALMNLRVPKMRGIS
jgi:hypothetical protein